MAIDKMGKSLAFVPEDFNPMLFERQSYVTMEDMHIVTTYGAD
jgi:hypothetical protein